MPRVFEGACRRGDLRRPAVDHEQLRPIGEARALGLGDDRLVGIRALRLSLGWFGRLRREPRVFRRFRLRDRVVAVDVRESAHEHLVERVGVVGRFGNAERTVLVFARQAVFEDDHGCHDIRARQVRHVVALDAQRRFVESERDLQIGEGLRARGVVGGAPRLVQHQRLLRVDRRRAQEIRLGTALGDLDAHALAAAILQPLLEVGGVVGQLRHEYLARDLTGARAAVGALDHLIDEVGARDVELFVDRRGPHAAHAAAAHDEVLHGGRQLVFGDAEQVGVGVARQHERAAAEHGVDRLQPVAVDGGRLVVHGGGCLAHARRQLAGEPGVAPRHERDEVVDDRAVLLDRDRHGARPAAAADLTGKARPAGRHGLLVRGIRARADREHLDHEVDRVVHGPDLRVRAEVAGARDAPVAGDDDARGLVGEGDRHVRVGLVVFVAHVERRRELLDPHVLELQRLDVAADHGPLHRGRRRHHAAGAFVQRVQRREVVRQPRTQVLRLADVEHPALRVAEAVHTGLRRDLARLRLVGKGVRHQPALRADSTPSTSARKAPV